MYHKIMNEELISIRAFAIIVNMHYNTIYKAVKCGRIHAFRIGASKKGSYRICKSEISRIAEIDLEDLIEKEVIKRLQRESNEQK